MHSSDMVGREIPPKNPGGLFARVSSSRALVEARRRGLERWLTAVLASPTLRRSRALISWLGIDDASLQCARFPCLVFFTIVLYSAQPLTA
jgi:hypothetical protein